MHYTDSINVIYPGEFNQSTGKIDEGYPSTKRCRIDKSINKIIDYRGMEVISSSIIYFPVEAKLNIDCKIGFKNEEKKWEIKRIEIINDYKGRLHGYAVYI